jgi:glycosyltransferase involved in cell wall biosynthesis
MRIVQVVPHYVPAYRFGGPLRVAHSLGKALVRAGHEVVVCTTNLAGRSVVLDVPLDQPVPVDGVTVFYEPSRLLRYWGFSPGLARRLAAEIPSADLVLVHAHYQFANWVGARVARRCERPYVVFSHGSLHAAGLSHQRWLKHMYLALLERRNFRRALFIAFNAPEEQAHSRYAQLGRVVPSGIDPSDFDERPPNGYFADRHPELRGKVWFLFLGRLDVQQKGLDLLIPAFARLRREQPQLHLVLAGPEEDGGEPFLRNLAHQLNVTNDITFTGMLTGVEKTAALQEADVFVLPSRYEGLSVALLEALYFGLPVLATNTVGLCGEIGRVGAAVITSADTDGIYHGLTRLADDAARRAMRGRASRLILEKYTWDAIACQLLASVRELVTPDTSHPMDRR